jgi:hypothetical protein
MAHDLGLWASSTGLGASEAEVAELGRLRKRFRRHRIFRDVTPERGVRYLAWGMVLGVRPHTIITDDLAELRGELEQSARHELGAGLLRYFARRTSVRQRVSPCWQSRARGFRACGAAVCCGR